MDVLSFALNTNSFAVIMDLSYRIYFFVFHYLKCCFLQVFHNILEI